MAASNDIEEQVLASSVAQYFDFYSIRYFFALYFVFNAVFAVALWRLHGDAASAYWGAVVFAIPFVRAAMTWWYHATPRGRRTPGFWEGAIFWSTAASFLAYGLSSWSVLRDPGSPANAPFILYYMFIMSGAMIQFAGLRRTLVAAALLFGGLLLLRLFSMGDPAAAWTAVIAGLHLAWQAVLGMRVRRAQEDAIRASAEKSRFLAAASHDLRQPLHAISLFGESLRRDLAGSPHEARFGRMMEAVTAVNTSLNAMLDISRLDAGGVQLQLQPVALNAVFEAARRNLMDRAEAKHIALRFRATPLWVRADPLQLERLVTNLADNAVKYTHEGGVFVGARRRRGQPRDVVVEVRDSGIGIAREHHGEVFQEFFQVGNAARGRAEGLGLGLSIVQRQVALMDLRLTFDSAPGRGSTFRLHCTGVPPPLETPSSDEIRLAAPISPTDLRGKTALLLDDELPVLQAMAELLGRWGVRAVCARDPQEALALGATHPVDFALVDYRIGPGLDGIAAVKSLQARLGRELPFVVITGETAPDRIRAMQAQGASVCFKPMTEADLLQALTKVI